MATKKTFYVTTPIYYPTAKPHLGTAYTTIAADVLARWHKLLGEEVFFLTGTDEHGEKLSESAKTAGMSPKEYVDKLVKDFQEAWSVLNIEFDGFIRTTDKSHEDIVKKLVKKIYENGDLYEKDYEGLYCIPCESYWTEKDLENEKCPTCGREVSPFKEKAYFFRLSKYQGKLLKLFEDNDKFLLPISKKNEIINRIKEDLRDVSFTRSKFKWGVEFPIDKKYVLWVWADALTNYISALGWPIGKNFKKFWPANVHLIGKDILWFHSVIWPAMLLSAGIKPPKTIFAHGWWTIDGEKMSKSKGNVVDPLELANKYGVDAFRYFILRATPFGNDGDFSEQALIDRNNNELANKFGNLVSRVSALAETYGIKKTENKLLKKLKLKEIEKAFENYELDRALSIIFEFIDVSNEYVQEKKPWETHDTKVLYELSDSIKAIAILLSPFMPETCEKVAEVFNFKINYKEINKPLKVSEIKKAEILFKKIEVAKENEKPGSKVNKQNIPGIINMGEIDFKEWEKIDLRVGEISKVEEIKGADKLYKLTVNIGKENRTVCAGIKEYYSKEDLKGKKIILFTNLKPRMMRGIESQGMILAAVNEDESKVVLISPSEDIENGAKVR
jgi:methionyl-tRNA synthetase